MNLSRKNNHTKMNYIYIRNQNINKVKVGGTCDIINRGSTYITGEYDKCKFTHIWKLKIPWQIVENLLKDKFKNLHCYNGGGIEYYKIEIQDMIEDFFLEKNIQFDSVDIDDIEKQIQKKLQLDKEKKEKILKEIYNDYYKK